MYVCGNAQFNPMSDEDDHVDMQEDATTPSDFFDKLVDKHDKIEVSKT
jgi:hypothetical protein